MNTSLWAGIELLRLITSPEYGRPGTSTVLFSSAAALTHDKGKFIYSASKSAVNAAARYIAPEISEGLHRVNSVMPGWTLTPMTEQAGIMSDVDAVISSHLLGAGRPEDICGVVLFLLSDDSRMINGANIAIDGGYSA